MRICLASATGGTECFGQPSKCHYEYFEPKNEQTDFFSFTVSFENTKRTACATFSDLTYFYAKYATSTPYPYRRSEIVSILSRRVVIEPPVPFDSLSYFTFASARQLEDVAAVAAKGSGFF